MTPNFHKRIFTLGNVLKALAVTCVILGAVGCLLAVVFRSGPAVLIILPWTVAAAVGMYISYIVLMGFGRIVQASERYLDKANRGDIARQESDVATRESAEDIADNLRRIESMRR